jgi:hypothetical protein
MSNLKGVNPPPDLRLTAQNNQQFLQVEDGIIITGHNQELVSLLPNQALTADTGLIGLDLVVFSISPRDTSHKFSRPFCKVGSRTKRLDIMRI